MYILPVMLLLAGTPFWETKAPGDWSGMELDEVLGRSPWVRTLEPSISAGGVPSVTVYLATARPMRLAEEELRRRARLTKPAENTGDDEYRDFLRESGASHVVLAVALPQSKALLDPAEVRRMEEECFLKIGRKRFKLTGHFPPAPSDPYLRLVFPRTLTPRERSLVFELYLPSVPAPYRTVEFFLKDLLYGGTPEF